MDLPLKMPNGAGEEMEGMHVMHVEEPLPPSCSGGTGPVTVTLNGVESQMDQVATESPSPETKKPEPKSEPARWPCTLSYAYM